jgi:hypothetical protein
MAASRSMSLGSGLASLSKRWPRQSVTRSKRGLTCGGSTPPVSRSHSNGRRSPTAVERKLGMGPFPLLYDRRGTTQTRKEMNAAPFEIIPAWRIARLRTALREAEQRGANPDDEGHDLPHRALQRRFALARGRAKNVPRLASKLKKTRKGRSFPHLKLLIIWRAILSIRSSAWKQGDTAPFGSIRRAHDQAVAACRAAGLAPPRYRTVYVLWHRGVPPADVVATLRGEDTNPTG